MCGVHVDQHQPVAVLGEHEDSVQLRQSEAERMITGVGQVGAVGSIGSPKSLGSLSLVEQRHPVPEQSGVKARWLGGTKGHRPLRVGRTGGPRRRRCDRRHPSRGDAQALRCRNRRLLRCRRGKTLFHGMPHELMHRAAVPESNLGLRRMDVDVDDARLDGQPQRISRLPLVMQHVAIRLAQCMCKHTVAYEAAVDEQILRVAGAGGIRRTHHPSRERKSRAVLVDIRRLCREFVSEQRVDARPSTLREQAVAHTRVVLHRKSGVRMRKRDPPEGFFAMSELGRVGAQEFSPGRGVEVELLHRHRGAAGKRRGLRRAHLTSVDLDAPRVRLGARPRRQRKPRHRRDAGQRLAAKAERADRLEIACACNFGCRVTRDREQQVLAIDPQPVVGDADELDATSGKIDVNLCRTRIETVLEQLLERGRGALDHLAGGDLIDKLLRKRTNGVHQCASPRAHWS